MYAEGTVCGSAGLCERFFSKRKMLRELLLPRDSHFMPPMSTGGGGDLYKGLGKDEQDAEREREGFSDLAGGH